MRHLILCPELPPAPINPGGIGTYVAHIAPLLAKAGETVHVIGTRWPGAPDPVEVQCDGRLIIHRVPVTEPLPERASESPLAQAETTGLTHWIHHAQRFAWPAALLAERLVRDEDIDIIEAQEFDAPLHLFQLRRSLGLGPSRSPPCIVHIHSPTELIHRFNEWDMYLPDYLHSRRMEEHSIASADALLCASHYLAAQCEQRYGLGARSITVIPYPKGDTPKIERSIETWSDGSVCYFGRLEPRKGVVEWVEAAVSVADEFPRTQFELIGADLAYADGRSARERALSLIPERLRHRFHFRGSRSRGELEGFLARAAIAVVPSRWENFPKTCIEAMSTGLPVIASPSGGMAEMVEDGRSGWIAPSSEPRGLAEALTRALRTDAAARKRMGDAAVDRIASLCGNDSTLARHLEFRERVLAAGSGRSLHLPVNLPWANRPLGEAPRPCSRGSGGRIGIVVLWNPAMDSLTDCLASVATQRRVPDSLVIVVDTGRHAGAGIHAMECATARSDWSVLEVKHLSPAQALDAGLQRIRDDSNVDAVTLLSARDRLTADYLETAARILAECPEVAVLSTWMLLGGTEGTIVANPCPALPYQLLGNEVVPAAVFRLQPLVEAGGLRTGLSEGQARWDVANAILAGGGTAVTLPGVHVIRAPALQTAEAVAEPRVTSAVRRRMLERVSPAVARDALELIVLLEATGHRFDGVSEFGTGVLITPRRWLRMPASEKVRILRKAAANPAHAARWLFWHLRSAASSAGEAVGLLKRTKR